jgi:small subunit ribosomal protein S6
MVKTSKYETIMILNTKLGEEGIASLFEEFKTLIEKNGTVDSVEDWGKRRLAYEIEDETEGYYYLVNFTSAPDFPAELDRIYKIREGVLRSLIVAK